MKKFIYLMAGLMLMISQVKAQMAGSILEMVEQLKIPPKTVVASYHKGYSIGGGEFIAGKASTANIDYLNVFPSIKPDTVYIRIQRLGSADPIFVGATGDVSKKIGELYTADKLSKIYGTAVPANYTMDNWALQFCSNLQRDYSYPIDVYPYFVYQIDVKITLAEYAQPLPSKVLFKIHGNGSVINQRTIGEGIFYTMPSTAAISAWFASRSFTIDDFKFQGKEGSAVTIGGGFHCEVVNCDARGFSKPFVYVHCMSCEFERCSSFNTSQTAFTLSSGRGYVNDADQSNMGSNQSKVISCRNIGRNGQYAAVEVLESSECTVSDLTLDGGSSHISYGVFFNTRNSTVVKEGHVKGIHAECFIDSALQKFRGGGGSIFDSENIFDQKGAPILCELEVVQGSATVILNNYSFFGSKSLLAIKGAGGSMNCNNVYKANQLVNWKVDNGYTMPPPSRFVNIRKLP